MVKTPNMIYADSTESEEIEYGDYLSNITPITQTIGYDTLKLDKNLDGSAISFIVNGERKYFDKGLLHMRHQPLFMTLAKIIIMIIFPPI